MRIAVVLFCTIVLLLFGCGVMPDMASEPTSPQNPPTPRLAGILPLTSGNHWKYSYSSYDSLGNATLRRMDLDLSIPRAYGVTYEDSLVPLTEMAYYHSSWSYDTSDFREYVYAYEWENSDSGVLITYRDLHVTPGVYVVGEYTGNRARLSDSPVLWLAYPASEGFTTVFTRDTSTGDSVTITVMGTSEAFYHATDGPMPVEFYQCYLYRETTGESQIYYYYHPSFGALGYLRYAGGKLRTSYILKSFTSQ